MNRFCTGPGNPGRCRPDCPGRSTLSRRPRTGERVGGGHHQLPPPHPHAVHVCHSSQPRGARRLDFAGARPSHLLMITNASRNTLSYQTTTSGRVSPNSADAYLSICIHTLFNSPESCGNLHGGPTGFHPQRMNRNKCRKCYHRRLYPPQVLHIWIELSCDLHAGPWRVPDSENTLPPCSPVLVLFPQYARRHPDRPTAGPRDRWHAFSAEQWPVRRGAISGLLGKARGPQRWQHPQEGEVRVGRLYRPMLSPGNQNLYRKC
jgi:hypothetical protein